MPMVTSTKDNGLMTRLKVQAPIHMLTVHTTKVNGSMTSSTATVSNLGPMVPAMRVITKMVKRKAKVD